MAKGVIVKVEPARLQVKPGEQAPAIVTIQNRSEEVGQFLLQIEGAQPGWAEFVPPQVAAFPLQATRTQLLIHPPQGAAGALYHLTVRAIAQNNGGMQGQAVLDLDVPAPPLPAPAPVTTPVIWQPPAAPAVTTPPPAQAPVVAQPSAPIPSITTPPAPTVQAPPTRAQSTASAAPVASTQTPIIQPIRTAGTQAPGTQPIADRKLQTSTQIEIKADPINNPDLPLTASQWKLTLKNAGNVLDTFSFSLRGIKAEWVTIDPTELSLSPGEQGAAVLTVHPGDDTSAGTYPFVIRTFSHINLNQRTEISLKAVVKAQADFKLDITPREAESQGAKDFKVALVSSPTSNIDIGVDLTASDPDNACEYAFEPSYVFLPERLTVTTTLHVKPKHPLGPNERRQVTIKVEALARQDLAPPQIEEIRLTQMGATPVNLKLRPQMQSAERTADYTLAITNPANSDTTLVFSGEDAEAELDYVFQPPKLVLAPRGQGEVLLRVTTRDPFEGEGEHPVPFSVAATREGDLVAAAKIQGNFVQKPTKGIVLTLIPEQQSAPGAARYYIEGRNPRSHPITVLFTAKDEADAVVFSFTPGTLRFSPGVEGRAALMVKPKDKLNPGEQRRVHNFTVHAQIEGLTQPVEMKGVLAQTQAMTFLNWVVFVMGWVFWALQWIVAVVVILFMIGLLLAGTDLIAARNDKLGQALNGIIPLQQIDTLLTWFPLGRHARAVVYLLISMVDNFSGLLGGTPGPALPPINPLSK